MQVWFVYPGHVADIHQYAAFRPLPRVYTDITLQLLKMTHYPEKWQAYLKHTIVDYFLPPPPLVLGGGGEVIHIVECCQFRLAYFSVSVLRCYTL